ncbi:rho GTPase-activating protein gacF-like isoform X2 [Harmonia axyridis]|nr:rho GTPase-activating protein gacF-like isoform X2 [Harmonia axyridis]XP_045460137.1 rho GTPase-activating protein gacF-like isoform X2 [Harmonia axyridis]
MNNFEAMEFKSIAPNSLCDPFLNISMNDIDIGRESIPLLELSNSFGRESLGILKLGCDINNRLNNLPLYKNPPNNDASPNVLDRGFFLSSHSDLKSASTINSSNFSFNLRAPDQLSLINISDFPSSIQYSNSTNLLNDGFLCTTALSEKLLQEYRSRFNSLPIITDDKNEVLAKRTVERASEGCQINANILEDEGNKFNDSVFIEAHYLAAKFKEEGSKDGFVLDETDPPELINGDLESSNNSKEEKEKCDSEEIFKKIDKLLPANELHKLNKKLENHSSEHLKLQDRNTASPLPVKEKPVETEPQISLCNPISSSNGYIDEANGKSDEIDNMKDTGSEKIHVEETDRILQALSLILTKNDRSKKDTEEGQCLLNTLQDMLSNNSKEKSKSIINESSKSTNCTNNIHSTSTKSQSSSNLNHSTTGNSLKKKHSNSFSYPNKALKTKLNSGVVRSPSFDGSKTKNSVSSAESSVEVRNYSGENRAINLKLKKINSTTMRRGPMKATVPMENITKPQIKGTPTKTQQILPKLKSRISTPIRDLQIKPMAQSTPDNKTNNNSLPMEITNVRSLSSSNIQEKSTYTSPVTSVSSFKDSFQSKERQSSQLPRRNSVSEGRKSSTSSDVKRSLSMKESSIMKAMSKIRQNISMSKGPLRDCSNLSSRESLSSSGKIVTTPKRVTRGFGKENTSAVC